MQYYAFSRTSFFTCKISFTIKICISEKKNKNFRSYLKENLKSLKHIYCTKYKMVPVLMDSVIQ